ncbi:MAG: DEAD/DEAH box helicase [Salinirussus sp.]
MSRLVDGQDAVAVADVLPDFTEAFAFERFNRVQAATIPTLLDRDDNVVVSAPTASGKTAIAEVAICNTLKAGGTALYLAPLRALTNEMEREWERFEDLGYSVVVVTGERDLDPSRARRADILVMTPEKADSATRKHQSRRYDFITDIDCLVVDEVHLLDADRRGSVLEATVARLQDLCDPRVVALSATMQNVDDVAEWLDVPDRSIFDIEESARPVPLEADVTTYKHGENAFADKYRRLYRALDVVEPHLRDNGGALIFVASRRDAVRAAEAARDEIDDRGLDVGPRGTYDHHTKTQELENEDLRDCVLDGVAFHHAGLSQTDRNRVEEWFRDSRIQLLISTTTLAWGVNLPARCVVIRDTSFHDPLEGDVELNPLDMRQMIGRAGRPGYDERGYAWVVCDPSSADRYRRILREGAPIESRLGDTLLEHCNAEIALGAIGTIEEAKEWLSRTFFVVRPGGADPETRLEEAIESLSGRGFVDRDETNLDSTPLGRLASRYYLRLPTAERFADHAQAGDLTPDSILRAVAQAAEFESVNCRSGEAEAVEAVLGSAEADLQQGTRKVLASLRAGMQGSTPAALRSDAWAIRHNAARLFAAFREICEHLNGAEAANRVARVAARVETGIAPDVVGLTAIDGVSDHRAGQLAAADLKTPASVAHSSLDSLTSAGLRESVARRVRENARTLPAVSVEWEDVPATITRGESELHEVTIKSAFGSARASAVVQVNGVEMTRTTTRLGTVTLPIAVFGSEADSLQFAVRVIFPTLPISPEEFTHTIDVRDR